MRSPTSASTPQKTAPRFYSSRGGDRGKSVCVWGGGGGYMVQEKRLGPHDGCVNIRVG